MNNRNQTQKQMFQEINEVSFAVNDILLFLDTHPCDKEALAYFEKMSCRRNELLKEYARCFGPLTVDTAEGTCEASWKWMEQPFPWEQEGGCR